MAGKLWLAASILAYPLLVMTTIHPSAFAQEAKWELEVHGGLLSAVGSPDGVKALPEASSFTTVGGRSSKRVSSWLFGDGAALLNQVLAQGPPFRDPLTERIVPLDSELQQPLIRPRNGGAFGLRFGRRLSSRLIAEVNVDRLPRVALADGAFDQYLKTAETFSTAWRSVMRNYPPLSLSGGRRSPLPRVSGQRRARSASF